jgi:MerR HTH family regulatory protein
MNAPNNNLWTIEELSAQAALALSVDYAGQDNGRIREVPDARTVRFYTTLGLVDRPALMRGRTALYGRRHLLQLVAIKRLQAKGQTLVELQRQLVGLTDAELAGIAKLPAEAEGANNANTKPSGPATMSGGRGAFWTQLPAPVAKREPAPPTSELPMQGVPLADGVALLMSPARPIEADDIEAIRAVAAPLLKLLEKRRLH